MTDISIIGLFCANNGVADGQTVKTNILAEEIERIYGLENVVRINTFGWKKKPADLFFRSIKAVRNSKNVIFLTDEGGIKIFPWLLQLSNVGKECAIHYVVVGGWLPESLKTRKIRKWLISRLDGVYVETVAMKKALEQHGLENVTILPNFKRLSVLTEENLIYSNCEPYRLCTFSRVMKEKGISDAVKSVKTVNSMCGRTVYTLDIYGQVDPGQTEWFRQLQTEFPEYIKYCGIVPYDQSVDILKGYFALLFPTYFAGEGFAGSLIDAFSAGVPVIASKWRYNEEFVSDGVNGAVVPPNDSKALAQKLKELKDRPDLWNSLKKNCISQANLYMPDAVIDVLISRLRR